MLYIFNFNQFLLLINNRDCNFQVMQKARKLAQKVKRRERTLSVSLPHVIKDRKDVENLFLGNVRVKLPRQSSKSCHVVFPSVEEKMKNYKHAKEETVDGKRIILKTLRPLVLGKRIKRKKKKVFMPQIKPEIKVTQT